MGNGTFIGTVFVMLCVGSFAQAEDKLIEPGMTWKGSFPEQEPPKDPPDVIASAESWKALWKDWKFPGEVPDVDFEKNLLVVQTTVGSQLRLIVKLTDAGDLKVLGLATRDLRPGFRYVIATVPREGVISVNGKKLTE